MRILIHGGELARSHCGTHAVAHALCGRIATYLLSQGHTVRIGVPDGAPMPEGIAPQVWMRIVRHLPRWRAWTQTAFARQIWTWRPDCVFMPIQDAPFVLPRRCRLAVFIHDVAFLRYGYTFPFFLRQQLRFKTWHALHRAECIIVPSRFVARELMHFYAVGTRRITVVPHGVATDAPVHVSTVQSVLSRYGVPNFPYFLTIGAIQPRKNIARVMDAFADARRREQRLKTYHCVCIGPRAWKADAVMERWEQSSVKEYCHFLGDVSAEEKITLLKNARALIVPGIGEGFGLPVVEGFAAGVPVVCARSGALPEVAEDAALFFSPRDAEELGALMCTVATDESLRTRLIQAGKERVKTFSWEASAHAIADAILSVR